jgi:hypothetical protein
MQATFHAAFFRIVMAYVAPSRWNCDDTAIILVILFIPKFSEGP